ncbi:MAG: hybrid sensor histidine kinase/response regulator [Myxococcales bacterium]|nr:hybrid sensor histidine kinase/response regulator [Myxococcales bacterium]
MNQPPAHLPSAKKVGYLPQYILISFWLNALSTLAIIIQSWVQKNPKLHIFTLCSFVGCFLLWRANELLKDQKTEPAALYASIANWLVIIPMFFSTPNNIALGVLQGMLPVALALPYVSRRMLKILIGLSLMITAVQGLLWYLYRRGLITAGDPQIPTHVSEFWAVLFIPILGGLFFFLLWNFFSFLEEAIKNIGESNSQLHYAMGELRKSKKETDNAFSFLDSVLDNLADGLLVTNPKGEPLRANPIFFQMLGHHSTTEQSQLKIEGELLELIQKCQNEPHEIFETEVNLPRHRIGQATATGILAQRHKSTSTVEKDSPLAIFEMESGSFERFLGVTILLRDVTTEKEVDKMKTEFIATVSHELRTPLTSVLGFAKLIQKRLADVIFPELRPKKEEKKLQRTIDQVSANMEIIISEGERLTNLINDVLDIAKMESGKLEWHMKPLDIREVMERALSSTKSLFEAKEIEQHATFEENLPQIAGDADRLHQVMLNLLSNAIKFTDEGSVFCRVQREKNEIVISIEDSGIGIAQEDLKKVFEKFRQVGDTLTDKPKGTGLGLPICKEIIEHHGGRIWAESSQGKGSTFFFTLPTGLQQIQDPQSISYTELLVQLQVYQEERELQEQRRHKVLLIVDDESSIRKLLAQELYREDYLILEAEDGYQAIQQAERYKPNLILLDVLMPKMSGFEVASQLKQIGPHLGTPLLILSIMDNHEEVHGLGIQKFLTKPIENEVLQQVVEETLQRHPSPLRVLLYEEDKERAEAVEPFFSRKGDQLLWCQNFQEFIDGLKEYTPTLLLLNEEAAKRVGLLRQLRELSLPEGVLIKTYRV